MGALDHQLGLVDEVTYATAPVVTRFFEYNSESLEDQPMRTEGDPLRAGFVKRSDRFTPWSAGAAGSVQLDVLTKGFGIWLKHMLGAVATTGPAETTVYTHTATVAELFGKSFALQVNRPFHPAGTNQAFTFAGGKVVDWTLSNSVDANLVLDLNLDFASVTTATALATASYPASMDNLTWAGGTVTIGGANIDVNEFSLKGTNGLKTDRRAIRASTVKKEPTAGRRELEFSLSADFDSLTQRARAVADTRAGALAAITAKWVGPTLLGTTIYPELLVTIPAARFDTWKGSSNGPEAITQELSGAVRYDGSANPCTIAYKSADVTA